MLGTLLSFSLSDVIPFINNRGEATALISTIVISQQLSSATRVLHLSIAQELLLADLHEDASIASKELKYLVAICPLISTAQALVKQRFPQQVSAVNSHLDDLCRINLSLEQYSEQNISLARELEYAGCHQLSQQKMDIAMFEQNICRRISLIKNLSRDNFTLATSDLLSTYPPLSLSTSSIARNETLGSTAKEFEASVKSTSFSRDSIPMYTEEGRIGSSAKKGELPYCDPANSCSQFFPNSSISPSFSADQSIDRKERGEESRHHRFDVDKDGSDSLFKSGRDEEYYFSLDNDRKNNHKHFDNNHTSINDISSIKYIDPSQDEIYKETDIDSSGETDSKSSAEISEINYGKLEGENKKNNDTSCNEFSSDQITDRNNPSNRGNRNGALDTIEMSPPPESKPDNSTPTSSQTAFGGDNEESRDRAGRRDTDRRGSKRAREEVGEREGDRESSTISSDDPCEGHTPSRSKGDNHDKAGRG